MSEKPLVSVVMPAYNVENFAAASVRSVLACGYENLELILIEDNSTDNTLQILREFSDPRIRLIVHPRNLGLTPTLNEALSLAQGKYIYRMDTDDLAFPNALSKQVEYMETHQEIGVLGGSALVINEEGKVTKAYTFPENHDEIALYMIVRNCIIHPSVIIRTDILRDNGLSYPEDAKSMEDYALWLKLFPLTKFACLPIPTVYYRHRKGSATSVPATFEGFLCRKKIITGFLSLNRLSLSEEELLVFSQAACNYKLSHTEVVVLAVAIKKLVHDSKGLYPEYNPAFCHALFSLWWNATHNSNTQTISSLTFSSFISKVTTRRRHKLFLKEYSI